MTKQPQLLVHDHRDNVGVVVVENLTAGNDIFGVVTEDNSEIRAGADHRAEVQIEICAELQAAVGMR